VLNSINGYKERYRGNHDIYFRFGNPGLRVGLCLHDGEWNMEGIVWVAMAVVYGIGVLFGVGLCMAAKRGDEQLGIEE
jgi:hypothetical protein